MQQAENRKSEWVATLGRPRFFPLPAVIILAAAIIFVIDTITDLEIAVAVFYVAVVLISANVSRRRGVLMIAAGCICLTVVSFLLTPAGSLPSGLANSVISIAAIIVTTYLALEMEAARSAAQASQARFARLSHVTALAEMTASIAHEVNQPLLGVVANAGACLRWLSIDPPNLEEARAAATDIEKDAMRASQVIARVRAIVKKSPTERVPVNLNAVVAETLTLMRNDIEQSGVLVRTELAEELRHPIGDKVQFQQVVRNLVSNALDAMEPTEAGPREISISSANEGSDVVVAVRDSGIGLEPDDLELVFDAFYTTKQEGIGVGLTICRSIIEAHGGRISARPNSSRGTTVLFTLPAS